MKGYKIGFSETNDGKDLSFALITLEIPEGYPGGKFIGFPSGGYRSNVARVLNIRRINTSGKWIILSSNELDSAFSIYDKSFFYHPGEIVFPDKFDPNPNNICTNGIHFYSCESSTIYHVFDNWIQTKRRMYLHYLRQELLIS